MPDLTEEQTREITDHLLEGRKIHAIKVYHDATGASLKESKSVIEDLQASLRRKHPDKFPAANAGCAPVLTAALVLGGPVLVALELFA